MFSTSVVIRNTPKQVSLKGSAWNDQQMPQKYSQYRYKKLFLRMHGKQTPAQIQMRHEGHLGSKYRSKDIKLR